MRQFVTALFVLLTLMFSGCRKAAKQETEVESPTVPAFVTEVSGEQERLVGPWIFGDIDKAWEALEDQEAGYSLKTFNFRMRVGKGRKRRIITRQKTRLESFNTLLGATNLLSAERSLEMIRIDPRGVADREGFTVEQGPRRGIGTTHEVTYPQGYGVLAIRRVLPFGREYEEAIYTPYTPSLNVSIVRKVGFSYLVSQLQAAQDELRRRGVKSQAYPGRLVADVTPLPVAVILSIIEHVDPFVFEDAAKNLVQEAAKVQGAPRLDLSVAERRVIRVMGAEVLTVIGSNREFAYRYAVSSARARDLFQFIPRTYRSLRQKYPQAGLEKDFVGGMADHLNAAKATLLLFDSDLSYPLTSPRHRQFLAEHPDAMGQYLASAYNGGVDRTAKAIAKYGENWTVHVLPETRTYIRKYRALADVFAER